MSQSNDASSPSRLQRELGVWGATMMGLGAIVGTGVFVSIGIAAGIAGPAVILAIAIGAAVAVCNGLNSAQLAASRPLSGGTYEYGYHLLNPPLGFTAGWMFLAAKSASAATAALGFSGYLLNAIGRTGSVLLVPLAIATVIAVTAIVLGGMRRSSRTNIAIVSITLLALAGFILGGIPLLVSDGADNLTPFFEPPADASGPLPSLFHAAALMFVAYTGYGRIATLGEEVRAPRRTIPRAIIITLLVSMTLYMLVGIVGIGTVGAERFAAATQLEAAPLEVVSADFGIPALPWIIAIGAMTAMLGVLLNLVLGLSRVLLAMGRRRDMPAALARLDAAGATPTAAVIVVGLIVAALALLGDVRITWSFSAFTVLIYYAITNLAALRLPRDQRLYHPAIAWIGLAACLFLAFWVDWWIWMIGLGVIGAGLIWHAVARKVAGAGSETAPEP